MENERLIISEAKLEDFKTEISLRPKTFSEYVGQGKVKQTLSIAIKAAKKRQESLDHVLLYGPPGLGKTTLAKTTLAKALPTKDANAAATNACWALPFFARG